jgi:outer membrane protein assembly factor BamD
MNKFIYILLLAIAVTSCGSFSKAYKSDDVVLKSEVAKAMYEKGKYSKAIRLFEQIAPVNRGKVEGEESSFLFAKTYYASKQYYLAGYQFESFVSLYPKSERKEEAAFLGADCFYRLSPVYSLDQKDTEKALLKLQKFIDTYPNSEYFAQANVLVKELREKTEKKAFEIAKQYNTTSQFKAALKALDNFVADYPGTPYKEQALYYRLDSAYRLAMNSVESKKEERLNYARTTFNNLIKFNSSTEFKTEADEMAASIETELQKFSK